MLPIVFKCCVCVQSASVSSVYSKLWQHACSEVACSRLQRLYSCCSRCQHLQPQLGCTEFGTAASNRYIVAAQAAAAQHMAPLVAIICLCAQLPYNSLISGGGQLQPEAAGAKASALAVCLAGKQLYAQLLTTLAFDLSARVCRPQGTTVRSQR